MGKKQHQKDKLYLTCSEWTHLYGGKKKKAGGDGKGAPFRRLPFDHCALSLQPFQHPVISPDGIVYDLLNIVPFLKKYGIDPASGKKLEVSALVKLNYTKNSDGHYHCPVLYKVFNENSHIVAIKSTGNVFSHEAVEQLNLKAKNFTDLLNGKAFTKKDIITIQDPSNLDKFNFSNFYHLKNNLKVQEEDVDKDGTGNLKNINSVTRDILDEIKRESVNQEAVKKAAPEKADKFNAAHYSTGAVAASSTSTAVDVSTEQEVAILDNDVVRFSRVKKKGYVRIETSHGLLNMELHCDFAPKTCENFIKLSQKGYYDGTIFHRSIRNFMVQGGDPTGTGKGGESFWGPPFKDEFHPKLSHKGRGNLSMANSGPNTNKSQFFITYRSCQHLDKKHSIFGRVVGGLDTLNVIEKIETDKDDKPKTEIKILKVTVFFDPFKEVDEQLEEERKQENIKNANLMAPVKVESRDKKLKSYHNGVGKYINVQQDTHEEGEANIGVVKKKQKVCRQFGDFSGW